MLSTVIRLPTLKTLYLSKIRVPIIFFLGINITKLKLSDVSTVASEGEQSKLLTPGASEGVATTASHTVVDHCAWKCFRPVHGTRFHTLAYFSLI